MIGLYFGNLGKIQKESNFTARSHQSRRDVENLAANSMRFEKPTNIMAKSLRSHHDICWFLKHCGEVSTNLGEISVISARWRIPCRNLAEILAKISTESQNLGGQRLAENLDRISSKILARSHSLGGQNLAENLGKTNGQLKLMVN